MTQQSHGRRQPKAMYTVTCTDRPGGTHRKWNFTNRPAAEAALRRLSKNPTAQCTMEEEELWTSAPPADTVRVVISLEGKVLETSEPFPSLQDENAASITYDRYGTGHLIYTGPGNSARQAREDTTNQWEFLTARGLIPGSREELHTLLAQYRSMPWWLATPPIQDGDHRGTAFHGLLVCRECRRFLDDATVEGEAVYNCPGDQPGCRCKNLPAEECSVGHHSDGETTNDRRRTDAGNGPGDTGPHRRSRIPPLAGPRDTRN